MDCRVWREDKFLGPHAEGLVCLARAGRQQHREGGLQSTRISSGLKLLYFRM